MLVLIADLEVEKRVGVYEPTHKAEYNTTSCNSYNSKLSLSSVFTSTPSFSCDTSRLLHGLCKPKDHLVSLKPHVKPFL